ncbi:competence type IV pilus minor pilin ComGG [Bacillus tuaregi]|uniref:competence type IV pilus minor pilin ComGG n=1 Tax=Bacillus tuaregi TaxID=1816695 RepID=UPI0008F8E8F3|nr:competence type IV pilus minor pilin ComGG [Bacillus tuaregi]
MVRNQHGFTYPLTLCILILFSTVLMIYTEQYLTEKRMLIETEYIQKQDYYIVNAMKIIEKTLSEHGKTNNTGTINFYDGQVSYVLLDLTDQLWEIRINLKTGIEHREFTGYAYYDFELKKMIKWVERN